MIQREVKVEAESGDNGYYATGYPMDVTSPAAPPAPPPTTPSSAIPHQASVISTDAPFTEPGEEAENIDQGLVAPQPTLEVRKFSAPYAEWDATRYARCLTVA